MSLAGISIPVFWLSLTALYGLTFRWRIFPGSGRLPPGAIPPDRVTGMYTVDALLDGDLATFRDAVMRLILPALVLACYAVGLITRFTRSAVLEVLGNDYVRAAYAKGLPTRTIVTRHVLRAALVPIITVIGVTFAGLLAGTVLVERIFNWPGIGTLRLPQRHLARPVGDHGREPVRRRRVHRAQPHRRRPLRRHRSAGPHMTSPRSPATQAVGAAHSLALARSHLCRVLQ